LSEIEDAVPLGGLTVEQRAHAVLAGLWERFREPFSDQVSVLEDAAAAVRSGSLEPELHDRARREAHKLAGSLGTYGMPRGSEIARQLESWFGPDVQADPAEALLVWDMVVDLRGCLDVGPSLGTTAPASPSPDPVPFLLLVDDDPVLAAGLRQEAPLRDLAVVVVEDVERARQLVTSRRPKAVIIELPASGAEPVFDLMSELKAVEPPVPVVVLTRTDTFTDRVQAARRGGRGFLQKPVKAADVLLVVGEIFDLARGDGATLLAIDDDPAVLAALCALLEPQGHRVSTVSEPSQFWEALQEISPDLVVLDVDMPDVTGVELCQVMRADQRWRRLPVVFLTSRTDASSVQAIFEAGADDYVTKPIVGPELTTRIHNRLDRSRLLRQMAGGDG